MSALSRSTSSIASTSITKGQGYENCKEALAAAEKVHTLQTSQAAKLYTIERKVSDVESLRNTVVGLETGVKVDVSSMKQV